MSQTHERATREDDAPRSGFSVHHVALLGFPSMTALLLTPRSESTAPVTFAPLTIDSTPTEDAPHGE